MRNKAEDTSPFWVLNQYLDLNSTGKYHVTAHLEFQLGKGPRKPSSSWVKLSRLKFWVPAYNHRTDANWYHHHSVTKLQASFSWVQLLSHVWCFVTLWTTAHQASLSITNFQTLIKLMSIESVMPSNHLILCRPRLLPPSILLSIRVFSNESVLYLRWPKYWSFSFNITPFNKYSGLISFRMEWCDLPTPQFKSINSLVFSFLYSPTLTSIHD